MNRILPYKPLQGATTIALANIDIDGQRVSQSYIDGEMLRADIAALRPTKWTEALLNVEVTLPWQEIEERADIERDVAVVVRVQCDATNIRQSMIAVPKAGSTARATIIVPRTQYAKRASIDAFVVASVRSSRRRAYRRILSEAPPWELRFDVPGRKEASGLRPPGKKTGKKPLVDPVWADFADPPEGLGFLASYKDDPFFLQLNEERPCLYLNEALTGYRTLLDESEDRARSDPENALRDRELHGIALAAWISMFNAACAAIEVGAPGQEPSLPADWRSDVVMVLTPLMFPELSHIESLKKLRAAMEDDSGEEMRVIQALTQVAAARYTASGRSVKKHLKKLIA